MDLAITRLQRASDDAVQTHLAIMSDADTVNGSIQSAQDESSKYVSVDGEIGSVGIRLKKYQGHQ